MTVDKFQINLDNAKLLSRCLEDIKTRNVKPYHVPTSKEGVLENITHSYGDTLIETQPHSWPELKPLLDEINNRTNISTIHRSWYSVMSYGGHVRSHTHPNGKQYVCVYYVEVCPDHNPIEFLIDNEWVKFYPAPGDCLLFEKHCQHRVLAQHLHHLRCTINFEI